jgi:hypothetical protein
MHDGSKTAPPASFTAGIDNTDPSAAIPTILDVEASGFGRGGYPIEVGYVLGDGSAHCTLIRPAPDWTHWDPAAESIHGISQDVLAKRGRDIAEVARELNDRLRGQVVYSDGWANDYAWLGRLFAEANVLPRFKVESLRRLLSDAEAAQWHAAKDAVAAEMPTNRHRASGDAQLLQRALLRIKGMQPPRGASTDKRGSL